MLNFIKRFIPKSIFEFFQPVYHRILAYLGARLYNYPSKKLYVIGVTGTKGKTTTSNLIHHILNSAGYKTGLTTTVNFKIGDKEWPNTFKQTMLGRFGLQKLLAKMVKEGCKYAVIETSSEGILQYRHKFIDYDMAVFLNLSPEHLERHDGFENYRAEKIKLFEKVAQKEEGVGIFNLDDENLDYFLAPKIKNKYGYSLKKGPKFPISDKPILQLSDIKLIYNKTKFTANGAEYKTRLIGEFNAYNAGAAICVALSQNISTEKIQKSLEEFKPVLGRMEIIYAKASANGSTQINGPREDILDNEYEQINKKDSGFVIVIDYAHEPKSLEEVYKAARETQIKTKEGKLICVLGSAGGGRDKWKRPEMGKIAAQYCDEIILTNEDPYDENPNSILDEIETGVLVNPPFAPFGKGGSGDFSQRKSASVYKIIDRKEAIKKAISLAKNGDAVVLTGKGGEVWMCVENGRKIHWDETEIVKEILNNF